MTTRTVFENSDQSGMIPRTIAVITTKDAPLSVNPASTPGWQRMGTTMQMKKSATATFSYGGVTVFQHGSPTTNETLIVDSPNKFNILSVTDLGDVFATVL